MWKIDAVKCGAETRRTDVEKKEPEAEVAAFIGKGVSFKGTITYSGTVRIDGSLDGEIHTDGTLIVGETASVRAKITAGKLVSHGKINGDVVAKQGVKLCAPAVLDGSVQTPMFSIEDGVIFNGTCEMSRTEDHHLPREIASRAGTPTAAVKLARA
ncbi:MAG: polymer-forming cytoskeletal protein [Nitrospiraceae bacterium]